MAAVWDRGIWLIAGTAVGGAAQDALAPILEPARQNSWARRPFRVLSPQAAAALAARENIGGYGGIDLRGVDLHDDFRRNGIGQARAELETALARTWPGLPQLLELRRRGIATGGGDGIGRDAFRDALRRQGYTTETIDQLAQLLEQRLHPEAVAVMIQRGILPNTSGFFGGRKFLPVGPPTEAGVVPPMPQAELDPGAEFFEQGFDFERGAALTRIVGLPPGPGELLELLRRGHIERADFFRGIAEGNLRNEWAPALLNLREQLLPAGVLVNLRLRGWLDAGTLAERMALHGYSGVQAEDWYHSAGRPIAPVQAYTAWARGAPHVQQPGFDPGGASFGFDDFERAIIQSDIRPEWAPILWHNRFNYPSLFQLRRAVEAGAIKPPRALTILGYERYEPTDAQALVASWTSTSSGSQADLTRSEILKEYAARLIDLPTVTRLLRELGMSDAAIAGELALAEYRVVSSSLLSATTKTRTLYVDWRIDRLQASNELDALGIPAAARDQALGVWDNERELNRPELTATQLATAAQHGIMPAQHAYDRLTARGYTDEDARALLALHKVTLPA